MGVAHIPHTLHLRINYHPGRTHTRGMKRVSIKGSGDVEDEEAVLELAQQQRYARLQLIGVIVTFGAIVGALRIGRRVTN